MPNIIWVPTSRDPSFLNNCCPPVWHNNLYWYRISNSWSRRPCSRFLLLNCHLGHLLKIHNIWRRQCGQVVRALDLQFRGPSSSPTLTASWIWYGSLKFKFSATLVNSQLFCLRPVGIFNPVKFHVQYFFQVFAGPH